MAKAASKKRTARKPVRKSSGRASRKKSAEPAAGKTSAEEAAYARSLTAHGQAVKLRPGEKLPPGATHELVEDEEGNVRPVRRRFSLL